MTILARFWGPLAIPEAPKINKKASRKNSKISEAKKTPQNLKKGINLIGPAECADRGEDYGGGRRHAKTGKIWKKWKTEIEAKDGEKNLEDPARCLARRPEGGGSLRAFRRAGLLVCNTLFGGDRKENNMDRKGR